MSRRENPLEANILQDKRNPNREGVIESLDIIMAAVLFLGIPALAIESKYQLFTKTYELIKDYLK